MLHSAGMIHHPDGSALALGGNARQAAAEHADAVAQQTAVGRVMNVALDDRRVCSESAALGNVPFAGYLDYALMNLFGDRRTEQGEQATEGAEVGRGLGVVVGEAAVDQVAAQFAFQIAEAPAFQVLEHAAAQQAIGSDAGAAGAR